MTSDANRRAELVLRLLAGGFYVSLIVLSVALATGVVWFWDVESGPFGMPGWGIAGWCGFTVLFLVLANIGGGPRRAGGRPLERADAEPLFAMLDDLRERLGVGPVSKVRLKPAPMIGVTRVRRLDRTFGRECRALVIGIPLFRALSVEELRGALAHELAHFAGGDVQRGRIVNDAFRRIGLMRAVLERGGFLLTWVNPIWWYVRGYGSLLRRGAGRIRRAQEVRADALAASIVGVETYARALVKTAALGLCFGRMAPGVLIRAAEEKRGIDNFYREFGEVLDGLSAVGRRRLVRDVLRQQPQGPTDHPALRDRLESLGIRRPARDDAEAVRANGVVGDLDQVEQEMTPLVLRGLAVGLGQQLRRRKELREAAAAEAAMDAELEALERTPDL